jgi:hypothetical protein
VDLIRKLGDIDTRWLYVLLIIVVFIPMIRPIGLPINVGAQTEKAFTLLEGLKAGDTVVFDFGYYVDGAPDVEPIAVALFDHLFSKDVKIVCASFKNHGPMIIDSLTAPYAAEGKVYGTDYVSLGFLAGGETALAAWAADVKKAFPTDWKGNSTAAMPILQGIETASDFDMFVFFTDDSAEVWVRQIAQYKVPLIAGLVTVTAPQAEPFLQSGQLSGLLAGLRGAAEYEIVRQKPGIAAAGMDAQSMAHLLLILFIIFGNVSYFSKRKGDGGKGAKQ